MIKSRCSGTPLFLLGFSMGSVVALDYVLHQFEELHGVIAVSAPLGEIGVAPILTALARMLSRLWPRFSLKMRIKKEWISRDPEVVKAQRGDSLSHGMASARLGTEFEAAVAGIHARAAGLCIPFLMLHGSANRIADPEGGRKFFEKVTFPDKTYKLYKGAYHELDDDFDKDRVLADLIHWLDEHLQVV